MRGAAVAATCLPAFHAQAVCERELANAELHAPRAHAYADAPHDKFALARAHCGDAVLGGRPADAASHVERAREARQLMLYATPARVTPTARIPAPNASGPSSMASAAGNDDATRGTTTSPVHGVTSPHRDTTPPRLAAPRPALIPARAPSKTTLRVQALADPMARAAARHRLDPLLLHAIASVESNHDAGARSHAGAIGVMQVMPDTARRFGVRNPEQALHHPAVNINAGAAYLSMLQRHFDNNLELTLAAYNAGEGAVERYGNRIPPFPETQTYVKRVLARYEELQAHRRAGRITTRVDTMTHVGGWPVRRWAVPEADQPPRGAASEASVGAPESTSATPRRLARAL